MVVEHIAGLGVGGLMKVYVSVEFGAHSIKLLVSEFIDGMQHILFLDEEPSSGIESGIIKDKDIVVRDFRKLIDRAEEFLDCKIKAVVVMLPSVDLKAKEVSYDLMIPENHVQGKHIKNLFNKVYEEENNEPNLEIAFIYPQRFQSSKIRKTMFLPIGEQTRDLFVTLEIVYQDKKTLFDYVDVASSAGLDVLDIMPNPVALKKGCLSKEEMAEYACVVDIGATMTTITIYHEERIASSESFRIGSKRATEKLQEQLNLSLKDAEAFKITHGRVLGISGKDEIVYEQTHPDGSITYITNDYVAKLMNEAYLEIIRVIRQYLLEAGLIGKITHYYLIGGGVAMDKFEQLFKNNFGSNVSIRTPQVLGTRHPKYTSLISGQFNIHYLEQLFEANYQMVAAKTETLENPSDSL